VTDWVKDIYDMHEKFGFHDVVDDMDDATLKKYLEFRISFLQEELTELKNAETADDAVDALIDLCVVAIGTLDAFNVNAHKAWREVHSANMTKEVGVKKSRPNKLGLPDLIKPPGFKSPSHKKNVGLLKRVYD